MLLDEHVNVEQMCSLNVMNSVTCTHGMTFGERLFEMSSRHMEYSLFGHSELPSCATN